MSSPTVVADGLDFSGWAGSRIRTTFPVST
jgi:hypothetical protein